MFQVLGPVAETRGLGGGGNDFRKTSCVSELAETAKEADDTKPSSWLGAGHVSLGVSGDWLTANICKQFRERSRNLASSDVWTHSHHPTCRL